MIHQDLFFKKVSASTNFSHDTNAVSATRDDENQSVNCGDSLVLDFFFAVVCWFCFLKLVLSRDFQFD